MFWGMVNHMVNHGKTMVNHGFYHGSTIWPTMVELQYPKTMVQAWFNHGILVGWLLVAVVGFAQLFVDLIQVDIDIWQTALTKRWKRRKLTAVCETVIMNVWSRPRWLHFVMHRGARGRTGGHMTPKNLCMDRPCMHNGPLKWSINLKWS